MRTLIATGLLSLAALALTGCGSAGEAATTGDEPQADSSAGSETPSQTQAKPASMTEAGQTSEAPQGLSRARPDIKPGTPVELSAHGARQLRPDVSDSEADAAASTLRVEPEVLDLGTVGTNENAAGKVTLVNSGDTPITLVDCKTDCGCTTANCPKGQQLAPGEVTEVDVRVSTGRTARRVSKKVTFRVDGQAPVVLPVVAQVIAYVTIDPYPLNQQRNPEGRITIRAQDEQPFGIVNVSPPVVEGLTGDPAVEHVVHINWDAWEEQVEKGARRQLVFTLDHPKSKQVQTYVTGRTTRQQMARDLEDRGIDNSPLTMPGPNARLAVAVTKGDVEAIKKGVEEVTDEQARASMLALAARRGNVQAIEALLDAGVDVSAADGHGRTALMTAVQSRNAEAVKLLLERGADVNARDERQSTALFWAAGPWGDAVVVKTIIGAGADINAADANGMTPLMWAARFGDAAKAALLLDAGADVSTQDNSGKTALDYASGRSDQLESLLRERTQSAAGEGGGSAG